MATVPAKSLRAFVLALFLGACTPASVGQSGSEQARDARSDRTGHLGGDAKAAQAPVDAAPPVAVDVVVAFEKLHSDRTADSTNGAINGLVERLGVAARGVDLRVAVIGARANVPSAEATIGRALGADNVRFVNKDLEAHELLTASLAAACPVSDSLFAFNGAPSDPTLLCGIDLGKLTGKEMEHAWIWGLDPVRGALSDFLRPNARRIYVFISRTDDFAALFSGQTFRTVVESRLSPPSFDVVTVMPMQETKALDVTARADAGADAGKGDAGPCGSEATGTSTVYRTTQLAKFTSGVGGQALDFCAPNWLEHAASIQQRIQALR